MGYKYEVHEWWFNIPDKSYCYRKTWEGESFLKAMVAMWKLKRDGVGCVKLEWR